MGSCEKGERDVRRQAENSVFLRELFGWGLNQRRPKVGEFTTWDFHH